jgi:hypothetical protein
MVEVYFNVQSDNGSLTDEHALRQWSSKYIRALEDLKDVRVGMRLGELLHAAGLVEVDTKIINLPLSAWPSGKFVRSGRSHS